MTAPINVEIWANPDSASPTLLRDLGDYTLSPIVGEEGTVSLSYPRDGQNFALLRDKIMAGGDVEIAIRTDGTVESEERAILLTAKGDTTVPGSTWEFTGLYLPYLLRAGKLLPTAGADSTDVKFSGTPGAIIIALLTQMAVYLPGITFDFTATLDSNGAPWATSVSEVEWAAGRDLLNILQELDVELQMCEWQLTSGRKLRLFNPGTRGVDRTVPPFASQVTLEWGRDLVDAPATATNTESGTRVIGIGAGGITATATNTAAETARGRPILVYRSYNNVSDPGTLQALVQAEADLVADGQHEFAHELTLAPGCPVPGRDFRVGDWILRAIDGSTERLQVAQYTIRRGSGNVTATVGLGSLLDAHEVTTRRLIERLSNGSAVVGSSTTPPETDDGKAPAAPTNLTGASLTYKQGADTLCTVQVGWAAVTTNADTTPAEDVADYLVEYREHTVGDTFPWQQVATPVPPFVSFGGVRPNISIDVRVAARDKWLHVSDWSATLTFTTDADTTPPPKPAAPTGTIDLGRVAIEFSEKADDGSALPLDYDEWELHRSEAASYTPDVSTLVTVHPRGTKRSQWTPPGPEAYGVAQYFRIVVLDRDRNRSVPSNVLEAVPTAIGFADLPYKDNGNLVLDGSFEDPSGRTQNGDRSHPAWSFVQGAGSDLANHGAWFARVDATQSGARVLLLSDRIPVSPGQQFVQRAVIRRNTAANGVLSLVMRFWNTDGSWTDSAGNYAVADIAAGAWVEKTVSYHTVPVGAVSADIRVQVSAAATAGIWDVDRVETREALGTLLIQDAAITNAKIVNLNVAKLISGDLTATIALLGEIRTANSPNARVVINDTGIRKYDSTNVLRFEVSESTTMIDGTLITGKVGESRIEIGNSTFGRDNIQAYDVSNRLIVSIGQLYSTAEATPIGNGIAVFEDVADVPPGRAAIFYIYGSGPERARMTFRGRTVTMGSTRADRTRFGGYLELRYSDDGDTEFGRVLSSGSRSYLAVNSSGTLIARSSGSTIGEFNTNGFIATRIRGYSTGAYIETSDGRDIFFYWSSGQLAIGTGASFVKNFVIDHPDDPDRLLVHGCTESPNAGVEYWDTATIVDHQAIVELPPYFESLTRADGRQVQVSVVLDDEPADIPPEAPAEGPAHPQAQWPPAPTPMTPEWGVIPQVAASRPRDGRFRIACSGPDGTKVAWLVKAIRKDVAPLVPEPLRSEVVVHGDGPYTYITPKESAA